MSLTSLECSADPVVFFVFCTGSQAAKMFSPDINDLCQCHRFNLKYTVQH